MCSSLSALDTDQKENVQMNTLQELAALGQSVWYDNVSRQLVRGGELAKLIAEGVTGVTSNPAIFERAISQSNLYDPAIRGAKPDSDAKALFRSLAIEDIEGACDAFLPLHMQSRGNDGFVSIEVSPHLADDVEGTITEAHLLWTSINRPNLLIKVPATDAGVSALRSLIAQGINVNATLLFSRAMYEKVALAYLDGLERLPKSADLGSVASVASFFISRIDARTDAVLAEKMKGSADTGLLATLKGKTAISNAKLAYAAYKTIFSGTRWNMLADRGARPQRMLWASTGTKGKEYSDVLYVEELIGTNTINTMPPETFAAYLDHGKPNLRLELNLEAAKTHLAALEAAGISLDDITSELLADGLKKFKDAADQLYATIDARRQMIAARI